METTSLPGKSAPQLLRRFGEVLKICRLNKNYTQEYLAEKCKCSALTVHKIEKGTSVGAIYVMRYIIAVNGYRVLNGLNEIVQHAEIEEYKVKYKKRASK